MSIKDKKQPDEAKLLKRARKLDQDALTCIYQNYRDAIYRYVYHHLGNAQTAEDLTSDVFRRFLQALRNGGGPNRQLKAWLYRVAHNLIVDELRRRKHRNHKSLDETLGDTLRDDAVGLDRLAGDAIAMERVRRALLTLTEEQRQIIVLKFLEGMSNAEVAEITGRTVGAVKSLQHRGLDALRAQLAIPTSRLPRLRGERVVASSFAS
ncbi:MAG: sigma-70 family RNA polymerase sigma factor [Anaerolineae bacterium]|jgi:RNA polymerase sigma-70 factor (ECF subfamily)